MLKTIITGVFFVGAMAGLYVFIAMPKLTGRYRPVAVLGMLMIIILCGYELTRPRTGMEIYESMFDGQARPCVQVTRYHDAMLPFLDPDIYLMINTCPDEIQRIEEKRPYKTLDERRGEPDVDGFQPPGENWFTPEKFGNDVLELTWHDVPGLSRGLYMFINQDSTKAYVIDIGD